MPGHTLVPPIDYHALAFRCGVSVESAMGAVVDTIDGLFLVDAASPFYPKCRPGLGDMVASGLSSIGITKDRVGVAAKAIGIQDCGCVERQKALNKLGYKIGIGVPPESSPK